MRNLTLAAVGCLVGLGLTLPTRASQQKIFSADLPGGLPGSTLSVDLPMFDVNAYGPNLIGVRITLDSTMTGSQILAYQHTTPINFDMTAVLHAMVSAPGGVSFQASTSSLVSGIAPPNVQIFPIAGAGSDFRDALTPAAYRTTTPGSTFTATVVFDGNTELTLGVVPDNSGLNTNGPMDAVGGKVTVTYTYDSLVPEPSTLALAGLAALLLAPRLRRRRVA